MVTPRHRFLLLVVLLALMIFTRPDAPVYATTLPAGFTETLVASGLSHPTAMEFAPDGRLFVTLQGGDVRVIKDGALLPTPFLSLTVDSSGERGLLGIAFDPNFTTNRYLYVYHTVPGSPARNRVSRFTADATNPDVVEAGSGVTLLTLNDLSSATNHNGGALHFGSDGKLYVAVGENANTANAQTLGNLLGKMLRMNTTPGSLIPTDNPFYNTASGNNRLIWARGLRNPFTFAFNPANGMMFINDVGAGTWEEINKGIAGANYGWPSTEGYTSNSSYRTPECAYPHGSQTNNGCNHNAATSFTGCAITGGVFYSPTFNQFGAEYQGDYFFSDYCGDWIKRYDLATDSVIDFASGTTASPVDLDVTADGTLYYLARGSGGRVYSITNALAAPSITEHPEDYIVAVGESAAFTCAASGMGTITHQWQRNDVDIDGATATSYTLPTTTLGDDGAAFRCIATNSAGSTLSNAATLTVIDSARPDAVIDLPFEGVTYNAGDTIAFSGTGTDDEDGTLGDDAFAWRVDFHHDTHTHPFLDSIPDVSSGTFDIPTEGETSANVWYRIYLTVTDSVGLSRTVYRDLHPNVVTLTLTSSIAGAKVNVDGQPQTTPTSFDAVVGMTQALDAPLQTVGGVTYHFFAWADGGAAARVISVPSVDTTYSVTWVKESSSSAAPLVYRYDALPFDLRWNGVPGATGYWIQIDNNSDFSSPHVSDSTLDASTLAYTVSSLANGRYSWRVRVKRADGTWGGWSSSAQFTVDVA